MLKTVGKIFLTGLLTVLPIIVTLYFTVWTLTVLERFFGRQVLFVIPDQWYRTGMGLMVAIAVVFAIGVLMHGYVFRRLFGFVTRSEFDDVPGIAGADEVAVYLPMSYQVGGYTVLVPKSAIKPVDMSREEAMKFILTAGLKNASPAIEPPGEPRGPARPKGR